MSASYFDPGERQRHHVELASVRNALRNEMRHHVTEAILYLDEERDAPNLDGARHRLEKMLKLCEIEK